MSDVLVKGMKMPKNCRECNFYNEINSEGYLWFDVYCRAKDKSFDLDKNKDKPNWCPLVEVPTPHGRLIDADAFDERVRVAGGMSEEELTEDFKDGVQTVLYMLSKQPTIIEAEGSDT